MQYTVKEYVEKLRSVDWHYGYSDDRRAWEKGRKEVADAEFIAEKQPELKPIYEEYLKFINKERGRPTAEEFEGVI